MPSSVKGSALYNPAKGRGLWKPDTAQCMRRIARVFLKHVRCKKLTYFFLVTPEVLRQ